MRMTGPSACRIHRPTSVQLLSDIDEAHAVSTDVACMPCGMFKILFYTFICGLKYKKVSDPLESLGFRTILFILLYFHVLCVCGLSSLPSNEVMGR